jgi:hypothetical protein
VRAILAFTHAGPYSRGVHLGDATAAETYVPILAAHGVNLLFSGHDHIYQRGKAGGLDYVVTGGGGAPLYRIRCGAGTRRRCPREDGAQKVVSEHHYLLLTVYAEHMTLCPRRPDKTAIETCVTYALGETR